MDRIPSNETVRRAEHVAGWIHEDDFKDWTDPQVLKQFRQFGKRARVFNFDDPAVWDPVRAHLGAPEVIEALDRGMGERCEELGTTWESGMAPWELTTSDYWCTQIDRAMVGNWEEPDDIEFNEDGDFSTAEMEERYGAAYNEASRAFEPQPGTPDWYRLIHGCQFIAPWCAALGRRLFPELEWVVIRSAHHATTWGRSEDDPKGLILDILLTGISWRDGRQCTPGEIVSAVFGDGSTSGGCSIKVSRSSGAKAAPRGG